MNPPTITYRSLMILMVLVSMALATSVMANQKGELLRRTMAEIALLNNQMAQRKTDAFEIREALSVQLEAIQKEAWQELKQKGIKTEADALNNPRLWYDLMLMAEIEAYMNRYTQKIAYYRVAGDRLSYLYQQADDDLKIVTALSGMKIDALISQAEKILDGYLPDAQTIVIHPDKRTIEAPEKIWKTFRSRK